MFLAAETSGRLYLPLIVSSRSNDLYQEMGLNFQLKSRSESRLGTWRYSFGCNDCNDLGFFCLCVPGFTLDFFRSHLPGFRGAAEPRAPPCPAAPVSLLGSGCLSGWKGRAARACAAAGAMLGNSLGSSRPLGRRLLARGSLPEPGTETCFPIKQAGRDLLVVAVRAPELLIGTRVPAEAMKTARAVPFPANVIWLAVN